MLRRLALTAVLAATVVVHTPSELNAQAMSFAVDTTSDEIDVSPGDGVCATLAGQCTLRAAILEANTLPGPDTITFAIVGSFVLSRPGAADDAGLSGDLDINDDVTIVGNGTTQTVIDGGGLDRVFHVDPLAIGIRVQISQLTVRGGATNGEGGGIFNTGNADLELSAIAVTSNSAARSGGIANTSAATATITDAVVSSNHATTHVGGLSNQGITTLTDVSIDGNTAGGDTGGMFAGGLANLTNVTVSNNVAHGAGQGGMTGGLAIGGSATLVNSTISGNTGDPGGIWNGGQSTLTNVTIDGNTGGIFNCNNCGGSITLANSIVSDSGFWWTINCYGTVTSLGHNLDDGNACGFGSPGDMVTTVAGLAPLDGNGGRTETHELTPASPALDAGAAAWCPPTDQRGVPRPQGAACDIGAYEARTAFVVNSPIDDVDANPGDGACQTTVPKQCTLRAAVVESNAHPGPDLITFAHDGRFPLIRPGAFEDAAQTGDLDVTDDLEIKGRGVDRTVIGGTGKRQQDRIVHVDPAGVGVTVRVSDLTLERGNAAGTGGGVENGSAGVLTLARVSVRANSASGQIANMGGGIFNAGHLALVQSEVVDNRVFGNIFSVGGGIANNGTLTMSDSTISRNSAAATGGGIDNGAPGVVTVTGSTVSANTSGGSGGGVWNRGTLTMTNATVSGNEAYGPRGGGINNVLGAVTLTHVTVTANGAGLAGGGIASTGSVRMRNTIVADATLPFGKDCDGSITSDGGNLDGGTSCALSSPSDLVATSPGLGALGANGGPTHTHALQPGTPPDDAADGTWCTATDQRGVARTQGKCDIGAFEIA